ncbi:glia maturation factor beta [Meira miltonrushii]|uniref:Glia maturation factor beta n=1 Tax=Meira miltonrushii TaxID=1280837 RepID=A0A316VH82_9BASI|nr:glia maturation factor beta [Meira miltonrushii]PWN35693.1 glia maturation factor beta [Meira miltonrushii]
MATVDIGTPLLDKIKDFRMSKHSQGNSAIVVKIDKAKLEMDIEDEFNNITLEDLKEELPENSPRFIVLSYELHHKDGRTSFPLVLIYWAPQTSSMELKTLYTSALQNFSVKADISGKVLDIREESEFDKESLDRRLGA